MDSRKLPPPPDFDENPEWTEGDFARARPASEVLPPEVVAAFVRPRGRPATPPETHKRSVTLRLSPEVLDTLRASGKGWQTRADDLLRAGLGLKRA